MDFEAVARAAVSEAGALLRARWRHAKTVQYKGAVDLVTESDREAETLIVGHLQRAFPDHLIVAEEASAGATLRVPAGDRYVWYLDPLDGTTNFAHGYPQFCVSLALARGADVLFGIVYDPVREETFVANRGRGATLNGETIHVSEVDDLQRALLATGFAVRPPSAHRLLSELRARFHGPCTGHPSPRLRRARSLLRGLRPLRRVLGMEAAPLGHCRRHADRA